MRTVSPMPRQPQQVDKGVIVNGATCCKKKSFSREEENCVKENHSSQCPLDLEKDDNTNASGNTAVVGYGVCGDMKVANTNSINPVEMYDPNYGTLKDAQ
eukprot:7787058-Ditylum_brightwellii.AAC.1